MTASGNNVQVIDALPQGEVVGGFRSRPSLGTARGIRRELAATYMELRRGDIDVEHAKAGAFILRTLLECIRVDELERRIEALEAPK